MPLVFGCLLTLAMTCRSACMQAMAAEDFAWWRSRLGHLSNYFSCLRVDHILGFFRIWEVPADCVTGRVHVLGPACLPAWLAVHVVP